MPSALLRFLATAFGLWVAARFVPGIHLAGWTSFLLAAFLLGVVNAVIRPVFVLFTLPLTVLSLGLFLFVVNGAMLALVAWAMPSFTVHGLGAAVLGSLVVSATVWVAGLLFPSRARRRE